MKKNYSIYFAIILLYMELVSCTTIVKDIDGNQYKTVLIGKQVWLKENLKTTKFNDGTEIKNVTNNDEWANLTSPAYSWYYNDETANKKTYGAFYNWYAVNSKKLCPAGWHVPSDAEWIALATYIRIDSISGGKLKEEGTSHWKIPNKYATNETGFTALPGGYRSVLGVFNSLGINGYWWSTTPYNESTILFWNLRYKYGFFYKYRSEKVCGFSVRCIQDSIHK